MPTATARAPLSHPGFVAVVALVAALALALAGCSDGGAGAGADVAVADAGDAASADASVDALDDAGDAAGKAEVDAVEVDVDVAAAAAADDATDDAGADDSADDDTATAPDASDCVPAAEGESCNGLDDDCDGATDEGAGLCDDGNACTVDEACVPSAGGAACVGVDTAGPCDDGDVCTGGESCKDGLCQGGFVAACDDQNDCTLDSCDSSGAGCTHEVVPNCGIDCPIGKLMCPKPLWCEAVEPLSCGGSGRCVPKPEKCEPGAPACGCDGKLYASECVAHQAAVNVQAAAGCGF